MEAVRVSKGKCFIKRGEKLKGLFLLLQGDVKVVIPNGEITMGPGNIIGMMEG